MVVQRGSAFVRAEGSGLPAFTQKAVDAEQSSREANFCSEAVS